ncbi:unnamed protein product [Protopolystoma xenopodis]|uniref:Deoxyhypusine hydroxylase n=1 Tax=Protopolystoma xenopodis TaxID=117903 RepID=A0A448X5C2_9PLAT|nr:unnamed protein product [Protopolystoma xenopodis]
MAVVVHASEIQPVSEHELREWSSRLCNPKSSLVERSRALWGLRHAKELLACQLIGQFICRHVPPDPVANDLLQHEAAYCLGQRGNLAAIDDLMTVVREVRHSPIVRHEAGEALAAIAGCASPAERARIRELLETYKSCDVVEVRDANAMCQAWVCL